jgi:hypothetical protein
MFSAETPENIKSYCLRQILTLNLTTRLFMPPNAFMLFNETKRYQPEGQASFCVPASQRKAKIKFLCVFCAWSKAGGDYILTTMSMEL